MSTGSGGGVISPPARAGCGGEAVKATAAIANTMPATLILAIILNIFD
jgi:hypothetical protein